VLRRVAFAFLAVALSGCPKHLPFLGSLQADKRQFHFEHEIELFEASNGMRIAMLHDARTNLVTVDVRYPVGSAEDPAGKSGMAHLVEHLSFLSRAEDGGPTLFERLGDDALWFNAWTNVDETHYTEVGFAEQLDGLLALEAQRMGQSCDRLDEKLFLRERDVVLEETAERGSTLDGTAQEILETIWGKGHPEARGVSSREIATAELADACAFMEDHYGPDQAILVITGDFDKQVVSESLQKHFGALHKHGVTARAELPAPSFDGKTSEHTADIEDPTAVLYFPAPAWGTDDVAPYILATAYLRSDLAKLRDEHDWIEDVAVSTVGGQRQRAIAVMVSVNDPAHFDEAIELVHKTTVELGGHKLPYGSFSPMVRRMQAEYLGGYDSFLGRGTWIADYLMYTQHQWFFLREMAAFDELNAAATKQWANWNFTDERMHIAKITPSGKEGTESTFSVATDSRVSDVQPWRSPVDPADAQKPIAAATERVDTEIVEFELPDNGLRVLLARDPKSPVVDARIVYPVGTAADPDDRPGLAYATAYLVEPDLDVRDAIVREKVRWALELGTDITFDVDENSTTFTARGLGVFADWTVWRLFYMLDYSVFPTESIDAMHKAAARAGDPDHDIRSSALRENLFGKDHPYAGDPLTGDDIRRIGRKDCEGFRGQHYKARGATLIVSGGFEIEAMEQEIAELFSRWDGGSPAAIAPIPRPHPTKGPTWLAFRDSSQTQVQLTIAFATGSDPEKDRAGRLVLEEMLKDRVRVARESLAATYGVQASYGTTYLAISGVLDPDRGGEAAAALLAELTRLRSGEADLAEDFVRARRRAMAHALADSAGASDTADDLVFAATHGLSNDYFAELARDVGRLTLDDVLRLIASDLAEKRMVVLVSGRDAPVGGVLEAAGVPVELVDAE
jgi:zinc protease